MGTPRRFEELSRLVDSLDRFAEAQPDQKFGALRGQKLTFEATEESDEPIAFMRFKRWLSTGKGGKTVPGGTFHVYESFWSPAAAGGISAFGVFLWILGRSLMPFRILSSRWRTHQRLKLGYLNRLFHDEQSLSDMRYQQVATTYRDFEDMASQKLYPSGDFEDFRALLEQKHKTFTGVLPDLHAIAERWRDALVFAQLKVAGFSFTTLATLFGLITLTIYLGAFVAIELFGLTAPWLEHVLRKSQTIPESAALGAALLLLLVGWQASRFLRRFLSDVVYWTTSFEKDVRFQKRREIVRACESTLRHVLSDPNCERIVIVGHSLGTAIAYETLLHLGRRVIARRQRNGQEQELEQGLRKISHFVTFGSPIDRIAYFFPPTHSQYHRFNRVADFLLGCTADPPFKFGQERNIRWWNVRDRSDLVASRLFSPRGPLPNRDDIEEIYAASSHFPDPNRAHTGYFSSPVAVKVLFDACILNRPTVSFAKRRPLLSRIAERTLRWIGWLLVFAAGWCLALGAAGFWLEAPQFMSLGQRGILTCLVGLMAVWAVAWVLDRTKALALAP
jgi:pimeloyl-ACP methyl ester carboxylesterase